MNPVVEAVRVWQSNRLFHPLECGKNSRHRPLVPHENGDSVELRCPDCDYTQSDIPDIVNAYYATSKH